MKNVIIIAMLMGAALQSYSQSASGATPDDYRRALMLFDELDECQILVNQADATIYKLKTEVVGLYSAVAIRDSLIYYNKESLKQLKQDLKKMETRKKLTAIGGYVGAGLSFIGGVVIGFYAAR